MSRAVTRGPGRLIAGLCLLAALVLALWPTPASAQDDGTSSPEGIVGVPLTFEDEPVVGVDIEVRSADGDVVGVGTTGEDGRWEVDLPGPGTYQVELLVETLPDGIPAPSDPETELGVTSGRRRPVRFQLDASSAAGIDRPNLAERIAQATFNGVKQGLIISLAAVGLSLIFGTTGLINFAHGELVTFGAVVAWWLHQSAGAALVVAALLTVVIAAGLGAVLERGMLRPLRDRKLGPFQFVVLTIGLGLVGRQVIFVFFGGDGRDYRDFFLQRDIDFGPFSSTPRDLWIMALSALVLVLVAAALNSTRIGKATRAVADNPDLAESSGIDVDLITLVVWMAGAGLAALGGIFLGSVVEVSFLMGFQLLLMMFAAVILGGLGRPYGAMVGGIIIGIATEVPTVWVRPEIQSAFALAVLILVLLFRPEGVLGSRARIG